MTHLTTRRTFLISMASLLAVAQAVPARAAVDQDAAEYVSAIGESVLSLANGATRGKALRNKFTSLLGRYVNLQAIAMSSLGQYRSKMPAGDKAKFNQLVTTYAAALFVWRVDEFRGKEFVVEKTVKQGNLTLVETKISNSKFSNEPIVWRLAGSGDNYKVVDLKIFGVWLSIAMRDAFSKELKRSKGDFESLYAFLAEAETW